MKTVLWLCNRPLEETPDRRDGTWFTSMARALVKSGDIQLSIVAQAKVKDITQYNNKNIDQWVAPFESLGSDGFPSKETVNAIRMVVDYIKPDLIHVWGTENYWGLLTARHLLEVPTLLEIQGLKYLCADVYYGGISLNKFIRYSRLLEILRLKSSIIFGKMRFEKWGKFEKEMIAAHKYISTQSDFVRKHMKTINTNCSIYKSGIMLREEFYHAPPWQLQNASFSDTPSIFSISSGSVPYKGLHVLINTIGILKKKYPKIILNIAGNIQKKGIRKDCYARFLLAESRKLGISDNVNFLGPLDANGIIQQFHKSSVLVIPSFIETYSLALAEAMYLGVPTVVSYAGAMPELANDGESALFFPVGDASACASQIDKILSGQKLSEQLSKNARKIGLVRNRREMVLQKQIEIYKDIIKREHTDNKGDI